MTSIAFQLRWSLAVFVRHQESQHSEKPRRCYVAPVGKHNEDRISDRSVCRPMIVSRASRHDQAFSCKAVTTTIADAKRRSGVLLGAKCWACFLRRNLAAPSRIRWNFGEFWAPSTPFKRLGLPPVYLGAQGCRGSKSSWHVLCTLLGPSLNHSIRLP